MTITPQNFSHEGWCDTLGCATDSCNCMMAYPIYLLQKMQARIDRLEKSSSEVLASLSRVYVGTPSKIEWPEWHYFKKTLEDKT